MEYRGKNNLIGQKFNHLLVLEYVGDSKWKCLCDCGKETVTKTSSLKSGKTKSCGCLRGQNTKGNTRNMPPKQDLSGRRFGSLLVQEYIKGGLWRCKCDCGNETIVDTRNLNTGHTRSCGCLVKTLNSQNNTVDMNNYENDTLKVIQRAGSDNQGIALWECKCKICGNTFITRGSAIRKGDVQSCGCVHSYNERKITEILINNNIEFSTQYTFPDLKGPKGGILRFDFAIFKDGQLSHLIEYNGIQHYVKPDGSWGDNFEEAQIRDKLKADYCKQHNIPLIIIKYDETYTLDTLLNNL